MKRTIYLCNPCYLHTQDEQLVIRFPGDSSQTVKPIPIEDLGVVILDHPQITIGQVLIQKLLENNIALVCCDKKHQPIGLMLNLDGHTLQSATFRAQVEAPLPLKKKLWQQTIIEKIRNQASLLERHNLPSRYLFQLSSQVRSGDPDNMEATAAGYYWRHFLGEEGRFYRDRFGDPPNNLLNYGYAILRAMVARSLVGSGLMPTLGIFHRNQYNAYCLADDIMEPYRPFVDGIVWKLTLESDDVSFLDKNIKRRILEIATIDVRQGKQITTLQQAISRTTGSLSACFNGKSKKILYPEFC
jgi:CRISPR-associated protein Cas1